MQIIYRVLESVDYLQTLQHLWKKYADYVQIILEFIEHLQTS